MMPHDLVGAAHWVGNADEAVKLLSKMGDSIVVRDNDFHFIVKYDSHELVKDQVNAFVSLFAFGPEVTKAAVALLPTKSIPAFFAVLDSVQISDSAQDVSVLSVALDQDVVNTVWRRGVSARRTVIKFVSNKFVSSKMRDSALFASSRFLRKDALERFAVSAPVTLVVDSVLWRNRSGVPLSGYSEGWSSDFVQFIDRLAASDVDVAIRLASSADSQVAHAGLHAIPDAAVAVATLQDLRRREDVLHTVHAHPVLLNKPGMVSWWNRFSIAQKIDAFGLGVMFNELYRSVSGLDVRSVEVSEVFAWMDANDVSREDVESLLSDPDVHYFFKQHLILLLDPWISSLDDYMQVHESFSSGLFRTFSVLDSFSGVEILDALPASRVDDFYGQTFLASNVEDFRNAVVARFLSVDVFAAALLESSSLDGMVYMPSVLAKAVRSNVKDSVTADRVVARIFEILSVSDSRMSFYQVARRMFNTKNVFLSGLSVDVLEDAFIFANGEKRNLMDARSNSDVAVNPPPVADNVAVLLSSVSVDAVDNNELRVLLQNAHVPGSAEMFAAVAGFRGVSPFELALQLVDDIDDV